MRLRRIGRVDRQHRSRLRGDQRGLVRDVFSVDPVGEGCFQISRRSENHVRGVDLGIVTAEAVQRKLHFIRLIFSEQFRGREDGTDLIIPRQPPEPSVFVGERPPHAPEEIFVVHERVDLMVQQQEAEWYRAIILMRKGKVSKSKSALQKIVAADGIYAQKAQELLDSKFNL